MIICNNKLIVKVNNKNLNLESRFKIIDKKKLSMFLLNNNQKKMKIMVIA